MTDKQEHRPAEKLLAGSERPVLLQPVLTAEEMEQLQASSQEAMRQFRRMKRPRAKEEK